MLCRAPRRASNAVLGNSPMVLVHAKIALLGRRRLSAKLVCALPSVLRAIFAHPALRQVRKKSVVLIDTAQRALPDDRPLISQGGWALVLPLRAVAGTFLGLRHALPGTTVNVGRNSSPPLENGLEQGCPWHKC